MPSMTAKSLCVPAFFFFVAASALSIPATAGTTLADENIEYSGTVYTWGGSLGTGTTTSYELHSGSWFTTTYDSDDSAYVYDLSSAGWSTILQKYNTLRFVGEITYTTTTTTTDDDGSETTTETTVTVSPETTTNYSATPLYLGGIIVESGAVGYSLTGNSTYVRDYYLGNANDTAAYSTINEDFTISNVYSGNNASGNASLFVIQGTQTWTIAEGKTFTLDSRNGFTVTGSLTISGAGTAYFSGDEIDASEATITVSSGATLDLSGSAVTLGAAISNAGTVTLATTTTTTTEEDSDDAADDSDADDSATGTTTTVAASFILSADYASENVTVSTDDSTGTTTYVFTVISGDGTVSGWDLLSGESFTYEDAGGRATYELSAEGGYTVTVTDTPVIWAGTDDATDWTTSSAWTFNGESTTFQTKDYVWFDGTSTATATVSADATAHNIRVTGSATVSVNESVTLSANDVDISGSGTTFTAAVAGTFAVADVVVSDSATLAVSGTGTLTADSIDVSDGASLTVSGTGTLTTEILTVAEDSTLTISSGTVVVGTLGGGSDDGETTGYTKFTTGTITVAEGATLEIANTIAGIWIDNISGAGTVNVALATSSTFLYGLSIGSNGSFTGTTRVTSGTFTLTDSSSYGSVLILDNAHVRVSAGAVDGSNDPIYEEDGEVTFSTTLMIEGEESELHANSGAKLTFSESSTVSGTTLTRRGEGDIYFYGTLTLETFDHEPGTKSMSTGDNYFCGTTTIENFVGTAGNHYFNDGTISIGTMTLGAGYYNSSQSSTPTVYVNHETTIGTIAASAGVINVEAGTLSVGTMTLSEDTSTSLTYTPTVNVNYDTDVGALTASAGAINVGSGATLTLTGTTSTSSSDDDSSSTTVAVSDDDSSSATLTNSSATGDVTITIAGGSISIADGVTFDAAEINVTLYSGNVTVETSELALGTTTTTSTVSVSAVAVADSDTTSESTALTPISGSGTLSSATINITLDSEITDMLASTATDVVTTYTFTIVEESVTMSGATIATTVFDELVASDSNWSYTVNDGTVILTYAVPEPASFGLLAGTLALALAASRRRRSRKA